MHGFKPSRLCHQRMCLDTGRIARQALGNCVSSDPALTATTHNAVESFLEACGVVQVTFTV